MREAVAEAIESHCVAVDERVESNRENVKRGLFWIMRGVTVTVG